MLGYLSANIICSEKKTVFRECSLRKTMSFEEQIMSNYKIDVQSYFHAKSRLLCLLSFKCFFFAAHAVLKIGEYRSDIPQF